MPRLPRIEFEGAIYHITARGNHREEIFFNDKDRELFLQTLEEAISRYGVVVYAYCLMPNHYHLLLKTPLGNISECMRWFQTTYTVRFNRKHGQNGHLFQGRFKAHLVGDDDYGRWLTCYIHLNPIRKKDEKTIPRKRWDDLQKYFWSSHLAYYRGVAYPAWLNLGWMKAWGKTLEEAKANYVRGIKSCFEREIENPWEKIQKGLGWGSDVYWKNIQKKTIEKNANEKHLLFQEEIFKQRKQKLAEYLKNESDEKVRIWLKVYIGREKLKKIAEEYGYADESGVSKVVKHLEQKSVLDKHLFKKLEFYKQGVNP